MSKQKVVVFVHNGVVEGVFTSAPDIEVTISNFDSEYDDQEREDAFWRECQNNNMHQVNPEIIHFERNT